MADAMYYVLLIDKVFEMQSTANQPFPEHEFAPTQDRSRRTQARILEAGMEILRAQGMAGLTMANTADRANVSVGSVYRRFGDKDRLFLSLQTVFVNEFTDVLRARMDSANLGPDPTAEKAIETAVRTFVTTYAERQDLLRVFIVEAITNPAVHRIGVESTRACNAAFSNLLSAAADKLKIPDFEEASDYAFRLVYGMCTHRVVLGPDVESPQVWTWERMIDELTLVVKLYLLEGAPHY